MINIVLAGLPCAGEGRQTLGFCSPFFPHFVPTGAEWRRPAVQQHKVKKRQIKQLERFDTGGLNVNLGKGWQSLEKVP